MNKKNKEFAEVEIHKGCGAEVISLGDDGISYCTECEHIVEGDTEHVSEEEFESGQS